MLLYMKCQTCWDAFKTKKSVSRSSFNSLSREGKYLNRGVTIRRAIIESYAICPHIMHSFLMEEYEREKTAV